MNGLFFCFKWFTSYEANKPRNAIAIENEFVSDTFKTTEKDLDEVKAGMKLLGIDTLVKQSEPTNGKHITQNYITEHTPNGNC